jgi:hypothetical protein
VLTPYTFTEQGMAMLSTVVQSKRAVKVNIEIMRAYVGLRRMLTSNEELARKLAALERNYDTQFKVSLMRFENSWRHQYQSRKWGQVLFLDSAEKP